MSWHYCCVPFISSIACVRYLTYRKRVFDHFAVSLPEIFKVAHGHTGGSAFFMGREPPFFIKGIYDHGEIERWKYPRITQTPRLFARGSRCRVRTGTGGQSA